MLSDSLMTFINKFDNMLDDTESDSLSELTMIASQHCMHL